METSKFLSLRYGTQSEPRLPVEHIPFKTSRMNVDFVTREAKEHRAIWRSAPGTLKCLDSNRLMGRQDSLKQSQIVMSASNAKMLTLSAKKSKEKCRNALPWGVSCTDAVKP